MEDQCQHLELDAWMWTKLKHPSKILLCYLVEDQLRLEPPVFLAIAVLAGNDNCIDLSPQQTV